MSNEWLHLDADRAITGAQHLRAAGEALGALRSGPGAELADASGARPWGADEYGAPFERQYRPVEQQVLEAWAQLAAYVEGLGDAAEQSVRDNQGADDDARRRFGGPP